jgi:hypothetical protein
MKLTAKIGKCFGFINFFLIYFDKSEVFSNKQNLYMFRIVDCLLKFIIKYMKNVSVIIFGILILTFGLSNCSSIRENTKKHSPEGVAEIQNGEQNIRLTYSRPYKKERLIFGEKSEGALVSYGKKWRTGANEATEISFTQSVNIDGQELPAGKYSLYTIPGPEKWIVAFNSRLDYWGATLGSPFKERKDVLRVEVPVRKLEAVEEQLLIELKAVGDMAQLVISWDKTQVVVEMD